MGTPTLRTNALTTLEALKQLLGIDETDTSQDSVLIQLINRASASIENALGRKLRRSTYTERVKGPAASTCWWRTTPSSRWRKSSRPGRS